VSLGILRRKDSPRWCSPRSDGGRFVKGFLRYVLIRAVAVAFTVAVGIYVAIWVSSIGGYHEEYQKAGVRASIIEGSFGHPMWRGSPEEAWATIDEWCEAAYAALDMDKPFLIRSFRYFRDAVTLDLGESKAMVHRISGSTSVKRIILEALPMTVLLFVTANLVTYFLSLAIALVLSRRYGSILDRLVTLAIPLLSAPSWLHGTILVLIFALVLGILPRSGMIDIPLPQGKLSYLLNMLKHMVLPVAAWV